ncbi:MAG: peptidoglycan-binding protein, partial [Holophagales bacterium]|nr:peptidoglycan-binding protein [Holophagales bacterium]
MKLQGRDLSIDMEGGDVRLLQDQLTLAGLTLPADEREQGRFGAGTRDAVLIFQKQRRLPTTGTVDSVTAEALGSAVAERLEDLRSEPDPLEARPLIGRLVNADTGEP